MTLEDMMEQMMPSRRRREDGMSSVDVSCEKLTGNIGKRDCKGQCVITGFTGVQTIH